MYVASDAIGIVALILVVILIRQIASNQDKKHSVYQALIEAGVITEAEAPEAEAPALPIDLAPPAQPSQNARCPRCQRAMPAGDIHFCGHRPAAKPTIGRTGIPQRTTLPPTALLRSAVFATKSQLPCASSRAWCS